MDDKKKVPVPAVPRKKPRPKPQRPRVLRLENKLPFEDHLTTIFDHNLDIIGRTIFLSNPSTDDEYYDGVVDSTMYSNFVKSMMCLEQQCRKKPIKIILASFGGSVDYGLAIYDRINISPCPIVKQGYGPLMSMGSVISQAKGSLELAENVSMMLHFTHNMHIKHDKLGKTGISEQDRHDELLLDIYCEGRRRRGREVGDEEREVLNQKMKETLYLTAPQAVEMGLADGIITKV